VAVVVNQASTNSVDLGNYYCEKRQIPPQNVVRIDWAGGNVEWSGADFTNRLLHPLLSALSDRGLGGQIDYVVLSMDIPYRVRQTGTTATAGANSTTSVLYYGFKPDGPQKGDRPVFCNLPAVSSNSYAGSEEVFRAAPPDRATTTPFLSMMITSSNLDQARRIVDRGVASDGSFPLQSVYLAKNDDRLRNIRYALFDDALFNTRILGYYSMVRTNVNTIEGLGVMLGFESGMAGFGIGADQFVPGAMADQLTSFAGKIFEPIDQTSLLIFLNAGATASFGTVIEPCSWFEKFPTTRNYFYQARGFTVAESYYQCLTNPYQGLLVGEPLAAPFAVPAEASWVGLPPLPVLSGVTNLSLRVQSAGSNRPVQQVDLFLNGAYLRTVTNIGPTAGNALEVSINGRNMSLSVPPGATPRSLARGLEDLINAPAHLNSTQVRAFRNGDRLELQSLDVAKEGSEIPLSARALAGDGVALTTVLHTPAGRSALLDATACGFRSYAITNIPAPGDFLEMVVTKTNGQLVTTAVTNASRDTTLAEFAKTLFAKVNSNPLLQGSDGVVVEDINMHEDYPYNVYVYGTDDHSGEFNVRARSSGWPAAGARIEIRGSPRFGVKPPGNNKLDENLQDLRPRGHLYVAAGVERLPVTFALDTTALPDGAHELAAVVYEGTHVRTQKRVSQNVLVRNTSLAAEFTSVPAGGTAPVEGTLQFSVVPTTSDLSRIELFGTGGSLGIVENQGSASFTIAGSSLGAGLHAFYALVTARSGERYRTETKWLRLERGGVTPPATLSLTAPPPTLTWPAVVGQRYEILGAADPAGPFSTIATVTATNSSGVWVDAHAATAQRFYRVRTSD
jgi:uncharacterized protein (TIGR03790 family)